VHTHAPKLKKTSNHRRGPTNKTVIEITNSNKTVIEITNGNNGTFLKPENKRDLCKASLFDQFLCYAQSLEFST